ncbi:MAG: hypothetical protein ACKN9T_10820 [Candidatus Methylumidiphilus sp.]
MYDLDYIFTDCGFTWVPEYIDRHRLFNVSYELGTGEITLYVLGGNNTFLYKISRKGIFKQYDALAYGADPARLDSFLGAQFDCRQIVIDTFTDNIYYVYLEDATEAQYLGFIERFRSRYGISESQFLATVNTINKTPASNLRDCFAQKSVAMVKVPFASKHCKLYAKPFKSGSGYELSGPAADFLARLHVGGKVGLAANLRHLWVSAEVFSGRVVVTAQHHALVHGQ